MQRNAQLLSDQDVGPSCIHTATLSQSSAHRKGDNDVKAQRFLFLFLSGRAGARNSPVPPAAVIGTASDVDGRNLSCSCGISGNVAWLIDLPRQRRADAGSWRDRHFGRRRGRVRLWFGLDRSRTTALAGFGAINRRHTVARLAIRQTLCLGHGASDVNAIFIILWDIAIDLRVIVPTGLNAGSSSTASLSSPAEEAASALPLRPSSIVEVEVRPWEKLEASPRRMSCRATSSSEMTLALVGSGVGKMAPPPTDERGWKCSSGVTEEAAAGRRWGEMDEMEFAAGT
ncbi:hypothetical protein KCU81_g279, partial [Aureobasidium melanogenum]